MKIGLLWFDNDPKRSLEDKISAGAERYVAKFGVRPNACFVNPAVLEKEKAQIEGLQVLTAQNILPHHFWLGVQKPQG